MLARANFWLCFLGHSSYTNLTTQKNHPVFADSEIAYGAPDLLSPLSSPDKRLVSCAQQKNLDRSNKGCTSFPEAVLLQR